MLKQATASLLALGAATVGVDATVLNEKPIQAEYALKEHVSVVQRGDVVEATLPWKDQAGIKIKYDMGEPTAMEKMRDKRKTAVYVSNNKDKLGAATDVETFDYGLVINEKPDTNRFCWTVEGAEQYDWFKQPPLTAEEIAEGAERPENVVNSYAVYHKQLKNQIVGQTNYETGKVFHRYRVQATDSNGAKVWGDSEYENGQICDIIPTEWLDMAVYPVTM